MLKLIQMRPELLSKKITLSIFISFLITIGFLVFNIGNAQACTLRTTNWSTTSSTIGSIVNLVVSGEGGDCMGQGLSLEIWERDSPTLSDPLGTDDRITSLNTTFDRPGVSGRATAITQWGVDGSNDDDVRNPPYDVNYQFYFVAKSQTGSVRTSGTLFVPIPAGGGTPPGGGVPPGGGTPPGPGKPQTVTFEIPNPIAAKSLIDLAKAIGKFLFQIAIPIAVIVIIYAGILFLTSRGNKEQVAKASKALWYAVVGLAIILIGQGFFTLIKSILDLGAPTPPVP